MLLGVLSQHAMRADHDKLIQMLIVRPAVHAHSNKGTVFLSQFDSDGLERRIAAALTIDFQCRLWPDDKERVATERATVVYERVHIGLVRWT